MEVYSGQDIALSVSDTVEGWEGSEFDTVK